ncbi:MAG: hypothetical protein ACTHK1_06330 [Actinomycetales bacterium]
MGRHSAATLRRSADQRLRIGASLGLVTRWPAPPPGYLLGELLGVGKRGVMWSAVQRSTGRPVVLERVRADAALTAGDGAARSALVSRASLLARWVALQHPRVVRMYPPVVLTAEATGRDHDELVLVTAACEGRLADVLASRRWREGQALAVCLGVADALAAIHAAGLVHGRVGVDSVLMHEGIAVLGPPRFDDGLPASSLSDDVAALVRLVRRLWGNRPVPPLLARTLADAGNPRAGVDANAVAAALRASGKPARLPAPRGGASGGAVSEGRAPAGGRRRLRSPRRRLLSARGLAALALVAVVALTVAVHGLSPAVLSSSGTPQPSQPSPATPAAVGVAQAPTPTPIPIPTPPPTPTPTPPRSGAVSSGIPSAPGPGPATGGGDAGAVRGSIGSAADARRVLTELDERRAFAFATDDQEALRALYEPQSQTLRSDLAALQALHDRGVVAVGLRLPVRAVSVVAVSGGAATLRVTDERDAYQVIDADGTVVEWVPGRGERSWVVGLVQSGGGWRYSFSRAVAAESTSGEAKANPD